MSIKRFRSRRQWNNTLLVLGATPFLLLVGVILFTLQGKSGILLAIAAVCVLGLVVALVRDLGSVASYSLDGEQLILMARRERQVIELADVLDVSLIDRSGAREYILAGIRAKGINGLLAKRAAAKRPTRFTTVDIGLNSYTFGVGRRMIDRMPDARKDLVLVRLRDGDTFILSPEYNQELISSVSHRS